MERKTESKATTPSGMNLVAEVMDFIMREDEKA